MNSLYQLLLIIYYITEIHHILIWELVKNLNNKKVVVNIIHFK